MLLFKASLLVLENLTQQLALLARRSIAAHPGYSRTSLFANNWHFLPKSLDFVKDFAAQNTVFSMSSYDGSMMTVRAVLDESIASGSYVTPMVYAIGTPVVSQPKRVSLKLN